MPVLDDTGLKKILTNLRSEVKTDTVTAKNISAEVETTTKEYTPVLDTTADAYLQSEVYTDVAAAMSTEYFDTSKTLTYGSGDGTEYQACMLVSAESEIDETGLSNEINATATSGTITNNTNRPIRIHLVYGYGF